MFLSHLIFRIFFIVLLGIIVSACMDIEPEVELSAEAIVVGAGISGLSAAVEMGRAGVNVLVLDRNSVMGGHAVMAGGFAVVNTPIQSELGFQDTPELAYQDWIDWTEDGDPDWTRYYAENSRRMIYDWVEEMGAEWVRVAYGWENSIPRFHYTDRGALGVVLALFRTALELPNITFQWNESVESLVVSEGQVTGARARNLRTGHEKILRARHIVLATGGFEGNLDRVRANWSPDLPEPGRLLIGSSVHATGSGHDLAVQAGAALTKMNRHYIYNNGIVDPRDPAGTLSITGGNEDSLWVNTQGQRFTNETGRDKRILVDLLEQNPATYWAIFDELARDTFAMRGREWVNNPMDGHSVLDNPDITHKAPTLEALASMAGIPEETLRASIQRFNELVESGVDEDFGRFSSQADAPPKIQQPPFYALQFFPMTRKSMGGIAIDTKGRALNEVGEVVSGLYVVGEANGSAGINGKHGMDGMFLGPSVVTGRVAGQTIVEILADMEAQQPPISVSLLGEDPLPTEENWEGNLVPEALGAMIANSREGYWHFEKSHEMVLEREYECDLCHSAQVPFFPVNNRQSKLAQTEACANCHGR